MDFQTRARLTDSAVWAALVNQVGTLSAPEDVEAVLSGAVQAVARLAHWSQAEPDAAATVEVLAEAARGAVKALSKENARF